MAVTARGLSGCLLPGISCSADDLYSLVCDEAGCLVEIVDREVPGLRDCGGRIVIPSLVDLHFHGIGDHDVLDPDGLRGAADVLGRAGVGDFCCSSIAMPPDRLSPWLQDVGAAAATTTAGAAAANCLGAHVEGSFIEAAACGAHDPTFIFGCDLELLDRLFADPAWPALKTITIGPGGADAALFTQRAVAAGARVALGHTRASYEAASAVAMAGASCVTHVMNASPAIASREPGLLGVALRHPMFVEAIPNPDILHPVTLELVALAVDPERLVAVSDSIGRSAFLEQELVSSGLSYRAPDGTILGGAVGLADLLPYLRRPLDSSPYRLIRATSQNALAMLGLPPSWPPPLGAPLRVVAIDDSWNVVQVAGHRRGSALPTIHANTQDNGGSYEPT